jgi:WD40 repeat protein
VTGVAFSPDGKWLAATGDCGVAMIWDADSGE